jgi:hypothetical protein
MTDKKTPNQTDPSAPAQVVKVKPYPFDIEVIKGEGIPPVKGKVLKLTDVGFLMRTVVEHHFKVHDNHQVRFELPVVHHSFNEKVKVIKTYDSAEAKGPKEIVKLFTIEMHFLELSKRKREEILKFIKAIGQK